MEKQARRITREQFELLTELAADSRVKADDFLKIENLIIDYFIQEKFTRPLSIYLNPVSRQVQL